MNGAAACPGPWPCAAVAGAAQARNWVILKPGFPVFPRRRKSKSVAIWHLDRRQTLGVHNFVLLDDVVTVKQESGPPRFFWTSLKMKVCPAGIAAARSVDCQASARGNYFMFLHGD
jgi:hypothetical protein